MRIADVETFVVENPPPAFGGTYFVVVKLTTDDGVVGYGEAYGATFRPNVVASGITDLADQFLIGHDPHHIERFWRRAYGRGFTQRPDVTLSGATSGLEMACWDIVGKAAGKPVYELLGGRVHESLRSYTYLYPEPDDETDVYVDPELGARRALEEVERGFTAVKLDPAGPYTAMGGHQPSLERLDLSERFVRLIRDAVGDRADILFGTHGQFTSSGALRLARRLEPFDPLWFEEPVPPDDVASMAKVAHQTSIPIATGERLTSTSEFARVLEAKAASIIQLNLARAGGLLEGKKIAALAEAFGAQIAPHCYNGPIGLAANIQLATCSPNFLILEVIRDLTGFHADLLRTPLRWEDGRVVPSNEPGLGVELDEDVARAHAYTGDRLHLNMADDPIDVADPLTP
ncbi:MAG: mandelate racemase/muconate lactonizing enzyme family protein [Ilumatobacter sp.]|uniref:mandelate racemase/muconate lactonizing enzyme family protein n=1 Tax=Ilumatobacter sp. TaxID=1967498 RepID=UPI00260F9E48|nr:mandelate racemase/muconate lactonizing enzyme family protein [Ilumatobacter sp.]MDJ0769842.1 mandelate racemase/muconate lactonizing enzyme family protein [Ilumatobacter sp.]